MKQVILICPEPIREQQQGIGIRFLEMAAELCCHHHVSLWVPNQDFPRDFPFTIQTFPDDVVAEQLVAADVVLVHGHIYGRYRIALERANLETEPPLVVDLYDPFLIENLHYTEQLGRGVFDRDRDVLFQQLANGDFFLTSSDAQRLFYIGVALGMGRFEPGMYRQDRTLRSVFAVAPFGVRPVSPTDLEKISGRLKGVVPGIGEDDLVLLFGGIYDWYDPDLLFDVLGGIFQRLPNLRVIFSANPSPDTTPQSAFERTEERAKRNGWTGHRLFFLPWFPYRDRFAFLKDVDLALSLHQPSLETELSLRTRILEYLNLGIPIIATEGGESGRILQAAGGGALIPAGDRVALEASLLELLEDGDRRAAMGVRGRSWVQHHMTWDKTLAPLIRFCEAPRRWSFPRLSAQLPPPRGTLEGAYRYWRREGTRSFVRAVANRLSPWSRL